MSEYPRLPPRVQISLHAVTCRCAYLCVLHMVGIRSRRATILHVCISAQTSLSPLPGAHAASTIYLKSEEEKDGDRLMRSENLLPGSQYYNYFISG